MTGHHSNFVNRQANKLKKRLVDGKVHEAFRFMGLHLRRGMANDTAAGRRLLGWDILPLKKVKKPHSFVLLLW